MKRRTLVASAMLITLAGCASGPPPPPLFVPLANQALPPPKPDRAQIVFLEPINSIQGAGGVGLFELDGDKRTLLAITGAHSKVALDFTPGRHMLMANRPGGISHLLEANVEAGKRYYVLVRFIYAGGFQLRPLRPSGESDFTVKNRNFPDWVSSTRFVEKTTDGEQHFQQFSQAVDRDQATAWNVWRAKTPEQRAELTLLAQDAIPQ